MSILIAIRMYLATLSLIGVTLAASLASYGTAAAKDVYVGATVPARQRIPIERIQHTTWDALLEKYVDDRGMVDYQAWKKSATDQQKLDQYLVHLSAATMADRIDKRVTLAYWINAYNAITVKGILREYPTKSIRDHTSSLFGYNIWKNLKVRVDGKEYSLDDIEHAVLRKLGEPRIHFAIVCASIGCPRLLAQAYTPDALEEQLTANAKAFFADRSKFQADPTRETLYVSPILDWFGADFGGSTAERLRQIAPYLPDATSQRMAHSGAVRLKFLDYDWNLNDKSAKSRRSSKS
ncbi:MAG: DUF547 domain-containing protein [Pirellulales bacterium]|nr:DUF547 domain-containing protein [Pirellulales bacterium]